MNPRADGRAWLQRLILLERIAPYGIGVPSGGDHATGSAEPSIG